jgi:hypothetical protein
LNVKTYGDNRSFNEETDKEYAYQSLIM